MTHSRRRTALPRKIRNRQRKGCY